MARIFISYARKDGATVAEELANRLRAFEHDVFLDVHSIRAGTRWRFELRRRIAWSQLMIVLVTPASNASEHVRSEIDLAERLNRAVLPIQIDGTPMPPHLRSEWQGVKMESQNYDRVLLEIEQTLRHLPVQPLTRFLPLILLMIAVAGGALLLVQSQATGQQSTPDATQPTNAAVSTLAAPTYHEDFEDGAADDWGLVWGNDFTIIDDGTGNRVWRTAADGEVAFQPSARWRDYGVALDYQVISWDAAASTGLVLAVRRQPTNTCSRYDFVLHPRLLVVGAADEMCDEFIYFTETSHASQPGAWHTIYLEVRDSWLQWRVNNGPMQSFQDTRYAEGSLGILNLHNTEIWFDNLHIWLFD